jgi:hypothetical protein
MTLKVYEHLLTMNEGFDQVQRSLKALAKYPGLQPDEVHRCAQLAREACAVANSHVLEALEKIETADAGRLFVRRREREQKDERGKS